MEFEELAEARAELFSFVDAHQASVEKFYDEDELNYSISVGVKREPGKEKRAVEGLTSTFTCLESLLEAGAKTPEESVDAVGRLTAFVQRAFEAPPSDWRSDNSGWAYCRLRSMGTIARHAPSLLDNDAVIELLRPVWGEASDPNHGAYGVRELSADPHPKAKEDTGEHQSLEPDEELPAAYDKHYTPNSYLTYWALYVGSTLHGDALEDFKAQKKALHDWLYSTLSEQIAFHGSRSPHSDPQQLAWSIAGVVRSAEPAELVTNAPLYDIVHEGLRAFFEQQHDRGDWDRGKPLFNYAQAGTAYCYGYETLGELLAVATDDIPVAPSFRKLLRPFASNLVKSFRYARDIALPLNAEPNEFGWGSGHQANRPKPESWATASVFRFMQRLRVLIGRWTNEEAQKLLGARPAKPGIKMAERGASWNLGYGSTGSQLSCYFALPLIAEPHSRPVTGHDPDERLMSSEQGRSAILFGPPGTGKTTIVEGVAAMLGWPFVEMSPAQFLDRGLDQVSSRADQIFRQMMELDRCVVLLDEIDELVKSRTNDAEAWERFFTTTMLPRLARLWEMGKIMFFANTNDIREIDSAIRRSQRFDAAILVLPPGESSKTAWLGAKDITVDSETRQEIDDLLAASAPVAGEDIPNAPLVWFPLVRYDQKKQLIDQATLVNADSEDKILSVSRMTEALEPIGRGLARQDWSNFVRPEDASLVQAASVTRALRLLRNYQRRGNLNLYFRSNEETVEGATLVSGDIWIADSQPDDPEEWARERGLTLHADGSAT
ncbi:hypothetical protein BH10ACT7_BH10ACT7_25070 [soil metagenome]